MEELYQSPIVKDLAKFITSVASKNPPRTTPNMWYLSAEQHAFEFILFNLIYGVGLIYTLWAGRNRKSATPKDEIQELPFLLKVERAILTICFIVTFIHKLNGNKIQMILMPCHVATSCYLYCLWTPNKARAESMFNISVHYMFFTWLAMLFPDYTGLDQAGEILNFWVHHWILFIIPFHLLFVRHYHIDYSGAYYYRLAAFLGGLLHYDIYVPLDLLSGQNVGYMLCPPPKSPFQGPYFRYMHAGVLLIMGILCGFFLTKIVVKSGEFVEKLLWSTPKVKKQ